jgi:hypothetical protein
LSSLGAPIKAITSSPQIGRLVLHFTSRPSSRLACHITRVVPTVVDANDK